MGQDLERTFTTLMSSLGLRVEGLNTNPNLSFDYKTPVSDGFQYKNHHTVNTSGHYVPDDKVYITCVQTDGLGLGAWTKPGRGSIYYVREQLEHSRGSCWHPQRRTSTSVVYAYVYTLSSFNRLPMSLHVPICRPIPRTSVPATAPSSSSSPPWPPPPPPPPPPPLHTHTHTH